MAELHYVGTGVDELRTSVLPNGFVWKLGEHPKFLMVNIALR